MKGGGGRGLKAERCGGIDRWTWVKYIGGRM